LGLGHLESFLRRHPRIALDTSVFIYQMEANAKYLPFTDRVFNWIEHPGGSAITSTITMTELLVQAYRGADQKRVDEFYGLLSTYPNLEWVPPGLEIADLAAKMRAIHRMRTPDALQAGTAIHEQATAIITNDPIFKRVEKIETAVLDEFL
jgi:predicted nucleic acid-binding protein